MRLGQAAMEALRAEITGCLKPGDELVVACPVALKGTSVIAKNKKDKLAERFSAGFIQNCVSLWDAYGAGSIVWKIAQEADASALYAMGEGGFLSALWKMAEASEVGLEADFRKVPIRQETIEVCEIFDLNPYKLQADGAKSDMITLESEGEEYPHIFRMKGHDVFKFVSQNLPGFIKSFCDESEILPSEIDFWVLHQANTRIIDGIFKRLGIPSDRTLLNLENYGNTSSASMMIALYEALKGGRIKDKDKVAFVAFGAGMTLGALLYEA